MKRNTIKWMATALFIVLVSPTVNPDGHLSPAIVGDYDYGEKIAKKAYGRGCLGWHSISKFQGSNSEEMLERILESWHISSFTDEDLRDLSVYLSTKANQEQFNGGAQLSWLECLLDTQEVGGSSPPAPTDSTSKNFKKSDF